MIVTDAVGATTSDTVRLKVLVNPEVANMPTQYSAVEGGDVTLSIEVAGTLPMSYRWRKGFSTVKSETIHSHRSFLRLTNVQTNDGGSTRYTVVLTNTSTVSHSFDVVVSGPPVGWVTLNGAPGSSTA